MCEIKNKEIEEITEKAIRKDGDVTMVDLLNQEIEELTNQKEIEEMAQFIDSCQTRTYNECLKVAKYLVEKQGYRNVKDKVVLDKEEYEKRVPFDLYRVAKILYNEKCEELKQARQETAREILKLVFKHITTLKVWEVLQHNTWLSAGGNFTANKHIWDLLLEPIAQQFGVEIEE